MIDVSGHHFQYVVVLLNLDQVTVIEASGEQQLGGVDQLFDPLGNGCRAVMAEAAHAHMRLLRAFGQVAEEFAQAVE